MKMDYLFYVIWGYLSGSILFAYHIPRLMKHIDIRELSEDKNPGTFNAFVFGGIGCGITVLLLELLKGFLPVYVCCKRLGIQSRIFAGVLAAPVAGHAFSIFYGGKGGKGIAVSFGVLLGLIPVWRPVLLLIAFYLIFSVLLPVKSHLKRSIVTFLCFGGSMLLPELELSLKTGCVFLSVIVIYKHWEAAMEISREKEKWRTQ